MNLKNKNKQILNHLNFDDIFLWLQRSQFIEIFYKILFLLEEDEKFSEIGDIKLWDNDAEDFHI